MGCILRLNCIKGKYHVLYRGLYQGYAIFCSRALFALVVILNPHPHGANRCKAYLTFTVHCGYSNVIFSIKHSSSSVKHASKRSINGLIVSFQWPPFA